MKLKWRVAAFGAAVLLSSCSRAVLSDGVYRGKSSADDMGAYGEITLTVTGGNIAACDFVTWQKDGTVKGEDYGKVNGEITNRDFYEKAQLAVRAMKRYAEQYEETRDLNAIDAVSGATIAYNQFLEAAEEALESARSP
ncbi:FMN-binding domain-containing protein [Spirochaetia bacterium]|nr:FMN-binding domain-containing protein [Spirochaetia bacterium]